MSDFAYEYFLKELDNLTLPDLTKILDKVKTLIAKKENDNMTFSRKLGGFEEGYYMAPDFNETSVF